MDFIFVHDPQSNSIVELLFSVSSITFSHLMSLHLVQSSSSCWNAISPVGIQYHSAVWIHQFTAPPLPCNCHLLQCQSVRSGVNTEQGWKITEPWMLTTISYPYRHFFGPQEGAEATVQNSYRHRKNIQALNRKAPASQNPNYHKSISR